MHSGTSTRSVAVLVDQIHKLETQCQQLQEKLQNLDDIKDENQIEQLFQQDKLTLQQFAQQVDRLELAVAEEEEDVERRKGQQVIQSSKQVLEQLQKQHRLQLLRWKQWKEQHQRQILLEQQRLRRRKPFHTSQEELSDHLNTKIYSSLQNTKQILTSQVAVTNSNLDRIRKDDELLEATQSRHQNYAEHIQEGTQQLRRMKKRSRQSHWKLILSFVVFLLVCVFIVYQRVERSSWLVVGVARGTRVAKSTLIFTLHGLYVGMQYLYNLVVYCMSCIGKWTLYLWRRWKDKPQHSTLDAVTGNTTVTLATQATESISHWRMEPINEEVPLMDKKDEIESSWSEDIVIDTTQDEVSNDEALSRESDEDAAIEQQDLFVDNEEELERQDLDNEEEIQRHDTLLDNEEEREQQDTLVDNEEEIQRHDTLVDNEEELEQQDLDNEEEIEQQDVDKEEEIEQQDVENEQHVNYWSTESVDSYQDSSWVTQDIIVDPV
ncbi:hypothetical protein GAYE_SCF17G3772 [Galdieria yellowstonensis]|uniref:Sec20 C-terminal domain-containing protein n=1 Tax=Galdieria yellowstonensis TaxID=3028027 RepID=A0AAV9IEU2_9RHOD|nr:hypothetical protein GAYE_SCF17G3772 [Galdieria yellowstonensis]